MKILLLTSFFPPDRGGVPHHVSSLLREYRRRGHEVVVLRKVVDEGEEYELSRTEASGYPLYSLRYRWKDADRFERTYGSPRIEERFEGVLAAERPDVVHAFHLTGLGAGIPLVAKKRGVPFVLTLSDFWMGCPRSQRMTPALDLCPRIDRGKCVPCLRALFGELLPDGEEGRRVLARYDDLIRESLLGASALVSFSRFAKELYAAEGIPSSRIEVVPIGVDPDPFRGLVRTRASVFRIAFLGTVMLSKGPHVLLDALPHLPRGAVRILVHGEAAPWFEVRDYADRLHAQVRPGDPVTFTGPYDPADVPRLLGDADCLVVPSLWFETFSITIREGWLAGVPVVASRLGAMEEAIEDGVTGLLFRPGDARDLGAKLLSLLGNPELRRSMVQAPKSIPTVVETADRLLGLYARIR
ncbi:MAG: glycosyltransferase family 4 protein [Planctomycetes bacterium]|nr:glycosyltransferase family 4 protein [Planctomycetota bacterium]